MSRKRQNNIELEQQSRRPSILIDPIDKTLDHKELAIFGMFLLDDHGEKAYKMTIIGNRIVAMEKVAKPRKKRSAASVKDYEFQCCIGGTD